MANLPAKKRSRVSVALLMPAVVFVLFSLHLHAQAPEEPWRMHIGYRAIVLAPYKFVHDTHPDDWWLLPDSEVPGSAGTTRIDGMLHCIAMSFGYQPRLSKSFSLSCDMGILAGGGFRDKRKNANDTRPDNGYFHPSYIYTDAYYEGGVVGFASTAFLYHIKWFYIGVEAQLSGLSFQNGWYRYDSQDYKYKMQKREFLFPLSYGPKIGITTEKLGNIEAIMLFGRTKVFGVQFGFNFDPTK